MASGIEERLAASGLTLPHAAAPAANYVPWSLSGRTLYISGQLPLEHGKLLAIGKLGAEIDMETGQACARACALNLMAQVSAALGGDWERLARCLRLTGYVASVPSFVEQHKVVNGASDLVAALMGEAGRHARSAIGVPSLPLDAPVEVEGIFELA